MISRPHGFNFQPGDYCFVQIPSIASYEWHPFTISSCPEQEDVIWFHIRCVGTWTNRLYKLFEERNTAHPKIAINLNLPKEHVPPKISIKARPQTSSTTISFGSDLLELEDETHPLSPQMPSLLSPLAATCRTRPCSVASQGQDFSHMFREPAIINVDVDPAEDEDISRRVEVHKNVIGFVRCYSKLIYLAASDLSIRRVTKQVTKSIVYHVNVTYRQAISYRTTKIQRFRQWWSKWLRSHATMHEF